jgi:hypothetical protein
MTDSRRHFISTSAGLGAAMALLPAAAKAHRGRFIERRALFFDLSHEQHRGHTYVLMSGRNRYPLIPLIGLPPVHSKAYRRNLFARMLPSTALTHMVENVSIPSDGVQLSYIMKDPDVGSGTWQMSGMFLLVPGSAMPYAFRQASKNLFPNSQLKLSAKRRKYGIPAASSLQDLLYEQDVIDTTEFATTLTNLHPELFCADPPTAAHIQTNHIKHLGAINDLAAVLETVGPAMPQQSPELDSANWATLVPYTDSDNVTPLKGAAGNNKGLILYDAKWNPKLQNPWVSAAMQPALRSVKDDSTLGADVTSLPGRAGDLLGTIWHRNDGIASITQTQAEPGSGNANYTLSNITPNFNGYSLTAATSFSGGDATVTLIFKNWYLRWLGLFIQFYDTGGVVPVSKLPPGISKESSFDTASNVLFLGTLTPEFTIFGIPVQSSGNTVTFTFPASVASSAKILSSGLGFGSHTFPDTEVVGIVMTSVFNLSLPVLLIALGIGSSIDAFTKLVIIPYVQLVVLEVLTAAEGGTQAQIVSVFWRSIVKGLTNPSGPLKLFLTAMIEYFGGAEAEAAVTDAIPLVGAILQAVGALGALAEVTETSCEVVLSPWTYEYDLVGTYDLSVTIDDDPKDPLGFPAAAATYKVVAVFDNGAPTVQSLNMPGTTVKTLPPVIFSKVPLGGSVTITIGFYTADGTQVGHGTTGAVPNVPSRNPAITITEEALPIGPGVIYMHKQKTTLDAAGNHVWACAPAPAAPESPSVCEPNPGDVCSFRNISFNSSMGYIGYAWQAYSESACTTGGVGQFDQIANIPGTNGANNNAQVGYASVPCSLQAQTKLVYDPLGRPGMNYYLDSTAGLNVLRQIQLDPPAISDPRAGSAWGKFNLQPDDILLHPSGAVVTISTATSRMESLKLPQTAVTDAEAAIQLQAHLHAGQGTRPGLFGAPTVATITAEGVILIVEAGNNRIHAVDAAANPLPLFKKQPEPYFLNFSATGGAGTQYLDVAAEFSGFIYVLSYSDSVYRLDIYHTEQTGTGPITTTAGFHAAKVTVDYWRNVYSLNYEVLTIDGALPPKNVTEPSISQWIPTTPPPCDANLVFSHSMPSRQIATTGKRWLRRRDLWRASSRTAFSGRK